MKEAIGGISLFQIVISFLLLFTGVMCLTINHSKAYGVKDEIINILENEKIPKYNKNNTYELSDNTRDKIINYLNEIGHRITGRCPNENGWIGYTRERGIDENSAVFCIRPINVSEAYWKDIEEKCKKAGCTPTTGDLPSIIYYEIVVFYQLDIPIINIANLKLTGSTKLLYG